MATKKRSPRKPRTPKPPVVKEEPAVTETAKVTLHEDPIPNGMPQPPEPVESVEPEPVDKPDETPTEVLIKQKYSERQQLMLRFNRYPPGTHGYHEIRQRVDALNTEIRKLLERAK